MMSRCVPCLDYGTGHGSVRAEPVPDRCRSQPQRSASADTMTRRADMHLQNRLTMSLGLAAAAAITMAVVGAARADASVAPASAVVANDVLSIIGTSEADAISLDFAGDPGSVTVDL